LLGNFIFSGRYVEIAKDRLKHSLGMFLELEVVDKFPQPLDIKG